MFSHMTVGSNDIERSRRFYDATFAAMGAGPGTPDDRGRIIYAHDGAWFIVTPPIDGAAATHGNGSTIGLSMTSAQADAWHAAGVAAGGTAIENPPGVRDNGRMRLYLAYLRDPDGNKLCALEKLS